MRAQELEDRLIKFAVSIVKLSDTMPQTISSRHLAGQLLRSGTSSALNYGEARGGESRKDFIHKTKIVLKELRESFICLKIIHEAGFYDNEALQFSLKENNELISIFVKTTATAEKNSSG
jgi:four helix bundle protein